MMLAACSGRGANAPSPDPRSDILLITVDTLRADHLGIYGYSRRTSPNLDRWFADAAVFGRAYATQTYTPPSVASILTGRYPQEHRVRAFFQLMPPDTELVTDLLPTGYLTAAFVSNAVLTDEAMGIASRFDHYDDFVDEREPQRPVYERNARRTTDAVLSWLATDLEPERPTFLWVHYIDPHGPYHPPADWTLSFTHEGQVPADPERISDWMIEPSVSDALEYVDRYDEEIAFLDVQIGRLLAGYAEAADPDSSYVLFTADHGETMIERELWFRHGYNVYEELVHVPLMIRGPGFEPGVRARPVSAIDLVPTVLAMAGAPTPEDLPGRDLRRYEGIPADRILFAEASFDDVQWRAAISRQTKSVAKLTSGSRDVVETFRYDLAADPGERSPREVSTHDGPLRRLLALIANDPDPGGSPISPKMGVRVEGPKIDPRADSRALEALRALGYIRR
jgi:arylsulfatase